MIKDTLSEEDQKATDPGYGLRTFGAFLLLVVFVGWVNFGSRRDGRAAGGGCVIHTPLV